MSHPGHEIVKCIDCEKVIRQCRCASADKLVSWDRCKECSEKWERANCDQIDRERNYLAEIDQWAREKCLGYRIEYWEQGEHVYLGDALLCFDGLRVAAEWIRTQEASK